MKNRARRAQGIVIAVVAVVLLLGGTTLLRADSPDGRFTAVTGGVQDSVTGLIWQMPASATKQFGGSTTACTAPFRMPTIQELFTLLDVRRTPNPLYDHIFTDASNSSYWTSTLQVGGAGSYWVVDFGNGGTTAADPSVMNLVRCVQ